jgi:hypothetical protein
VAGVGLKTRFRHYVNLDRAEARLARLVSDFKWDRVDRVFEREIAAGTSSIESHAGVRQPYLIAT